MASRHTNGPRATYIGKIQAPCERVFDGLTTPGDLRRWFTREARIDLRTGGSWRLSFDEDIHVSGTFVSVHRPDEIVMKWNEWWEDAAGAAGADQDTSVTSTSVMRLIEVEGTTRLEIEQFGYPDTLPWRMFADELQDGWEVEIAKLRAWLERGVASRGA